MEETKQDGISYEFGPFLLTEGGKHSLLLQAGEGAPPVEVPLTRKEFSILLALVKDAGRVLGKDELMDAVWPDTNVEQGNLAVHVSSLRKKLGQAAGGRDYIKNEPRRGYRFTVPVRELQGEEVFLRRHTRTHLVVREVGESGAGVALIKVGAPRIVPLLAAVALAAIIVAGTALYLSSPHGDKADAKAVPVKTLAVLPFVHLNGNEEDEHLGLGMADALITRLSNVRELTVRPTSAVSRLPAPGLDAVAAGRQLGVEAVLEGSIQKSGERLRVTAQLVRTSDGNPLWADTFDEPLTNIFAVQDSISKQLAGALALNLAGSERARLARRHTENADAFQLYARGRYHWNKRSADGMIEAESFFRQAIENDPRFALAYVGLADTLATRGYSYEVEPAQQKALELAPDLGEAHASRGFVRMFHHWDWAGAERDFRRAIELGPGYGTAHQWYATLLAITGRIEEAKDAMRRALEIDPQSHNFLADMGQLHYFAREYREAEIYCRRALEVEPDFAFAHQYLSYIYLKTGRHDEAFEELWLAWPVVSSDAKYFDVADAARRSRERYRQVGMTGLLRDYIKHNQNNINEHNAPYGLALYYALMGKREEALRWLEKAVERRAFLAAFTLADPVFDDLRPDPRFQIILQRMELMKQ